MAENRIPADAVNPADVPYKTLYTGAKMPAMGIGTFGSDSVSGERVAAAVEDAVLSGYRMVDCGACYGNEHLIGEALDRVFEAGIKREDMFIISKVWNDMHGKGDVLLACAKTLRDLHLDYLDLYFVHWPFPNYHAPGCDVDARNPDSKPYIHEEFMACWRQMERLVDMGLVKHIGVSNVTIPKLELILRDCRIKPAVNEMELHPAFQQEELYHYCREHGLEIIGYCPIGSPARPERDKTPDDVVDTELPEVQAVAKAHGDHPATTCLKWAVKRGHTPIPFSTTRKNYLSNLRASFEDPITDEEFELLKGAERHCRLVKGHVFLWEGANDWQDLWDIDGTIPGWNGYEKK